MNLKNKNKDRDLPAMREIRKVENIESIYKNVKNLFDDESIEKR